MYFWVERVMVSSLTIYRQPPPLSPVLRNQGFHLKERNF